MFAPHEVNTQDQGSLLRFLLDPGSVNVIGSIRENVFSSPKKNQIFI